MIDDPSYIWKLADLLDSPRVSELPSDKLDAIRKTLRYHKIELYQRPSPQPGVEGGGRGASQKQLDFYSAFWSGQYRILALSGANQSSKTTAVGCAFCDYLRDYARDGEVFWVIAQSHDSMRDVPQKTLWELLPESMFPEGVTYTARQGFGQIPTLTLNLPGGRGTCEVWFKTEQADLSAFESARVRGIWWTECGREAIFDTIQPRLAAQRGWMLMDFVPLEAWHKTRIKSPAETGSNPWIYHQRMAMRDNAHNLAQGEIDYQRSVMSEETAAVRIDGKDAAAFGVVYKQFDPERHVVPDFIPPADCPRWRVLDYGYRNPTACLWVAALPEGFVLPDGRELPQGGLVVYREYYESERTVRENAETIQALSEGETYEGPVICDPTMEQITQANGRSLSEEYRDAGLDVRPGIRVQTVGERAMVEKVRLRFEQDALFFCRSCKWTIREHEVWKYKETKDGYPHPNEPFEDANNHTCDCVKLLVAEEPVYSTGSQGEVLDEPIVE